MRILSISTPRIYVILAVVYAVVLGGCPKVNPNDPTPQDAALADAAPTSDAQLECSPGEMRCEANLLRFCDAGVWVTVKPCLGPCDPVEGCAEDRQPGLSFIWVANTNEDTLSKVDTRLGLEVARYRACPESGPCDPSRTSVNLHGDAVVTNRDVSPSSVTKFAAHVSDCVDRNGNGIIETSTGSTEVLPWLEDECMVWHAPLPGSMTGGRATAWDGTEDPDTGAGGRVWIGTCGINSEAEADIYVLNGESGSILDHVHLPDVSCAYGGAVDDSGNFWIIDPWSAPTATLARIDATTLAYDTYPVTCAYGITLDASGFLWTGGSVSSPPCVSRFDPNTGLEQIVDLTGAINPRGIAVGQEKSAGYVWAADTPGELYKIDQLSLQVVATYTIGVEAMIGVAVDFEGYVWAVSHGGNEIYKFDPDSETFATVPVGTGPYTYSDMTGLQLRNVIVK